MIRSVPELGQVRLRSIPCSFPAVIDRGLYLAELLQGVKSPQESLFRRRNQPQLPQLPLDDLQMFLMIGEHVQFPFVLITL